MVAVEVVMCHEFRSKGEKKSVKYQYSPVKEQSGRESNVITDLLKLWCVMNSEVRATLSGMMFLGVFLRWEGSTLNACNNMIMKREEKWW